MCPQALVFSGQAYIIKLNVCQSSVPAEMKPAYKAELQGLC